MTISGKTQTIPAIAEKTGNAYAFPEVRIITLPANTNGKDDWRTVTAEAAVVVQCYNVTTGEPINAPVTCKINDLYAAAAQDADLALAMQKVIIEAVKIATQQGAM